MKWTNSYRSFGLKTKRSTGLKTIEHKQTDTTDSSLPLNDARRRASQAFRTSSRPRTAPQPRTMVFDDAGMRTSLRTDRLGSLTVEGRITRNGAKGRLPPDAPPSPPYEAGIPLPRTAAMTSPPPRPFAPSFPTRRVSEGRHPHIVSAVRQERRADGRSHESSGPLPRAEAVP